MGKYRPVPQLHLHQAAYSLEPQGLKPFVQVGCYPRHHLPYVGAKHHLVGKLLNAAAPLQHQDSHAEWDAELGLQLVDGLRIP